MGFEHERIHLETSSVLIRQLPVDMVTKPAGWKYGPVKHDHGVTQNPLVTMVVSEVTLGKPETFPSYGWDNEYGEVICKVPSFEASKYLTTNQEFVEFVKDGGYDRRCLWTTSGWEWKEFRAAKHPPFWLCGTGCKSGCGASLSSYSHCKTVDNNNDYNISNNNNNKDICRYWYRLMFDDIKLPMDWPVEVTYHEAKAFCAWKGAEYRLPAEAEHNVIRGSQKSPTEGTCSDIIYQDSMPVNLNLIYGSSTPVNMFSPNNAGFCDVFGNVWEWNEDHFNGLNGFHTHYLYDDFSAPCFDGKHHMLLGGSWASSGDEASRFARFAFRPHFVQHAGFRVVRNVKTKEKINLPIRVVSSDVFVLGAGETKSVVDLDQDNVSLVKVPSTNYQYSIDTEASLYGILQLEFGFRKSLPAVLTEYCAQVANKCDSGRSNCAVFGSGAGKIVFLLSRFYDNVLGVDICARFIDAAIKLKESQNISLMSPNGDEEQFSLDTGDINHMNITFKQLTWIPNEILPHDLVLLSNLHRVQNPKAWLLRLWEIVKPCGLLIVASVDNVWKKRNLLPYLSDKLVCIQTDDIRFQSSTGINKVAVSVWKHHHGPQS